MKKMLAICCAMLLTACVAFSGCAKDEPATPDPKAPGIENPETPEVPAVPETPEVPKTE
ncbi:MAG: hypothetical protein JEZ07_13420 [Phycisphaerae bacterium]|nr:hypothetical protein [Phycisphaerae bacterium]